jgi:hypothetical protein
MNRFWESCPYGIYMNIIFYIKKLKILLQAIKKLKICPNVSPDKASSGECYN